MLICVCKAFSCELYWQDAKEFCFDYTFLFYFVKSMNQHTIVTWWYLNYLSFWLLLISKCIFFLKFLQVSIVSVVYSQSELLQKEVFLVELVDSISKSSEPMSHLKAIYFLRPTSENIQYMRRQLSSPRFGEYHLCRFFNCFA